MKLLQTRSIGMQTSTRRAGYEARPPQGHSRRATCPILLTVPPWRLRSSFPKLIQVSYCDSNDCRSSFSSGYLALLGATGHSGQKLLAGIPAFPQGARQTRNSTWSSHAPPDSPTGTISTATKGTKSHRTPANLQRWQLWSEMEISSLS